MINGKELMIGDYVDVGADDCPPAVAVVEEIYGKANKALLSICKSSVIFNADDISPIKFTEEFFLKNRFRELYMYRDVVRLYSQDDITLRISLYPTETGLRCGVYDEIRVNYVHEFQHLLRLVGLSEMANNLKI